MSRPLQRPALWLLLAVGMLFLTACGGRITNTNWAGLSTDGERVYLAFGPQVLAYDPETQSQSWIYPQEVGAVQYYSAPSVEGDAGSGGPPSLAEAIGKWLLVIGAVSVDGYCKGETARIARVWVSITYC